jgi:hypothetical protein
MTASHRSLQHDYEVSCKELDFLVDVALTVSLVFDGRLRLYSNCSSCCVAVCRCRECTEAA